VSEILHPEERRPQRIAVLAGDGIGVDVTKEALEVLAAVTGRFGLPIEPVSFPWSADHYLKTGETLPEGALDDLERDFSAIFVGAYGDPRVPDMRHAADILLGIRFGLDLFINFRPVKLYDRRLCPLAGKGPAEVDFVIFRENTEGAYVGVGGNVKRGTEDEIAIQEEVYTRRGVERILRAAFDYAEASGRRRVCMADKSNILRFGHDLWQRCFSDVKAEYPDVEATHMYVDAMAMQMVRRPEQFDVIVTTNMFGDILTDLGAGLQGGLGVAASANLHPGRVSMFEPVHGSAPKYAGTGKANPVAAVLSMALMLEYLGHREAARVVEDAVRTAISDGQTTPDMGGSKSTSEVGGWLVDRVSNLSIDA
jgi:3-isopropylmalate dehydrogenase